MTPSLLMTTGLLGLLLFVGRPAESATGGLGQATRQVAQEHILPGYRKLADATQTLQRQAETFCASPSDAGLGDMRQAFHGAMDAWQSIRHIRFGPVELFLRHHKIQLWPDRRNSVGRQLGDLIAKEDPKVEDKARFAQASVAVQGLSAIERLLFAAETSPGEFAGSYRCRLLLAITANLGELATATDRDWSAGPKPYRETLTRPGGDNPEFASPQEAAARLLNTLYTGLTEMEELKLAKPMGDGHAKARPRRAAPRRAESWRSTRSLRNLRINLAALQALYIQGFEPLLGDAELRQRLRDAFSATARAMEKPAGDGLGAALGSAEGWAQLHQARNRLVELRRLVAAELAPALGLTLGFNSLDGD